MKVNIGFNEMNGYVNINPLKGCNPFDIKCENAQCTEIIVEITDYIPHSKLDEIVRYYLTKLRHGGSIIFTGTDLVEVYKILLTTNDISSANKSLFGEQNNSWGFKQGCTTLNYMVNLLRSLGLHIQRQRLAECEFMVEGIRA